MGGVTSGHIKKNSVCPENVFECFEKKAPFAFFQFTSSPFFEKRANVFEFLKRNLRFSAAWTGSAVVLCGVIEGIFSCFSSLLSFSSQVPRFQKT